MELHDGTYLGVCLDILVLEAPEGFLAQDSNDGVHGDGDWGFNGFGLRSC